jgi:hypothetical protein
MPQDTTKSEQIEKEQKIVRERGEQVVEAVRKVREEGVSSVEPPSAEQVTRAIEEGEKTLESFQLSPRAQEIGPKGQEVIEDIKKVLEDEKKILREKGEGEAVQRLLKHGWGLLTGLGQDTQAKGLFENWRQLIISMVHSEDLKDFLSMGGHLVASIRDTEAFLDSMDEMITMMRLMAAEKGSQALQQGETQEDFHRRREKHRNRLVRDLKQLMHELNENEIYRRMVQQGGVLAERVEGSRQESKETVAETMTHVMESEDFQQLTEDIKDVLQRAVGKQMDVEPFFEYTRAAIYDIMNNTQLSSLLAEIQDTLSQIADNPALVDDPFTNDRLSSLSSRFDATIQDMKNNPNIVRAREESQKLVEAIRNEPVNRQLIEDMKKLLIDIRGDKPGEWIDPDLLADLRKMLVPLLMEHLDNLPIPPVHGSGSFLGQYDYTLDNIKLSVPALVPDNIFMRIEHELQAQPYKLAVPKQRTFVHLYATDIQLHMKHVAWSFQRHTVPKMADSGYVDVNTEGHGITIRMLMELRPGDLQRGEVLEVLEARCRVHKWRINVTESKHNKLYEMLTGMFAGRIRRDVQHMVESKLMDFGRMFNEQLIKLIHEARERSQAYRQMAHEHTEQAKQSWEETKHRLQEKVQELKEKPEVQQAKEHVKERAHEAITRTAGTKDTEPPAPHEGGTRVVTYEHTTLPSTSSPLYTPSPTTSTTGSTFPAGETSGLSYDIHPQLPTFAHQPMAPSEPSEAGQPVLMEKKHDVVTLEEELPVLRSGGGGL